MVTTANKSEGNGSTALAKIDERTVCNVKQLRTLLEGPGLGLIQNALPAMMKRSADRLAYCALTEFQKNPFLSQCTGLSILACTVQAAELGLEIGGPLGRAYMVPYGRRIGDVWVKEAQFQLGYRGMIELALRVPRVANVYAKIVRKNDRFKIVEGTSPQIIHEPVVAGGGETVGAYAVVVYPGGHVNFTWMTRDEIERHRDQYSKSWQQAKTQAERDRNPWASAFNEMAKKTVVRRLLKQCPASVESVSGVASFDDEGGAPRRQLDPIAFPMLPPAGDDQDDSEPAKAPDKPVETKAPEKREETAAEKPADKPAPETPKENPVPADAPEVVDADEFFKLQDRTKITWGAAIGMIEKQFKVKLDQAMPFEGLTIPQRQWIVGELQKAAAARNRATG